MIDLPKQVRIVEVGPRDGLQNEKGAISTTDKVELIRRLGDAGLSVIEAGSFVSPKWVPQMADSAEVFSQLPENPKVQYTALTPNIKGFDRALEAGVTEVAVFAAASEAFSQKNINCSIAESVARFEPLMKAAAQANIRVRGYVSCIAGCPYQGAVPIDAVLDVSERLLGLGCYEISLGDTIGVGTVGHIHALLDVLLKHISEKTLAMHCHDTYGQALSNIYAALEHGIATVDAAVAGLGGCPYAKGASGNVATEDVIYMLNGLGIKSGVNLEKLASTGQWISQKLHRPNNSRVGNALHANR